MCASRMESTKLYSTVEERILGQEIVEQELGEGFRLRFDTFPHNKGQKGDEGIYGETVEIDSNLENPIRFLVEEHELLACLSTKLTNKLPAVSKVVFGIAKGPVKTP